MGRGGTEYEAVIAGKRVPRIKLDGGWFSLRLEDVKIGRL